MNEAEKLAGEIIAHIIMQNLEGISVKDMDIVKMVKVFEAKIRGDQHEKTKNAALDKISDIGGEYPFGSEKFRVSLKCVLSLKAMEQLK